MLSLSKLYHFKAAAVPLALAIFLVMGSLNSCSEDPPTGGKDSCDTCNVPCDTCEVPCDTCDTTTHPCDTCNIDKDSAAHAFVWTQYSIPSEVNITGVYVSSDTEIFVIGTYLYRFNGVSWNKIDVRQQETGRPLAFPDFTMFGLGPSDLWMVQGGILDHYIDMGYDWANEFRPGSSGLGGGVIACWGTSSNDMFFVGKNGSISHFDGTTFTKMTSPTTKDLRSVWGTSHNDVWAAGFNYTTAESVLLHYNGSIWTEQNLKEIGDIRPFNHALGEVWATDSAEHKIVIASGSLLHRKTDNGPWRSDSGYVKNYVGGGSFIGLWHTNGNNINDFCTAGDGGFISHWNGKTWKRYDEVYNSGDPMYITNAMSMKGNTICMVGKRNGTCWIAIGRRKPF